MSAILRKWKQQPIDWHDLTTQAKLGHITPLENLRPLFMHCKCDEDFRYKTNITRPTISHTCIVCKAPVDMEINKKNTAYVTIR